MRWTGQTPPDNTEDLLSAIEANITQEEPAVQWAMNFIAGWIGIYDQKYRARCIKLGENTGLYKDEMVSKGCTLIICQSSLQLKLTNEIRISYLCESLCGSN